MFAKLITDNEKEQIIPTYGKHVTYLLHLGIWQRQTLHNPPSNTQKIFRLSSLKISSLDSTYENVGSFFQRFQRRHVANMSILDRMVLYGNPFALHASHLFRKCLFSIVLIFYDAFFDKCRIDIFFFAKTSRFAFKLAIFLSLKRKCLLKSLLEIKFCYLFV